MSTSRSGHGLSRWALRAALRRKVEAEEGIATMTVFSAGRLAARMEAEDSLLLVIDVQEKLCPVMTDPRRVLVNGARLVRGARRLDVPVVVTEQYTKGLGPTMTDIRDEMPDGACMEKTAFCAVDEPPIRERLAGLGRRQAVLCGIEMHVCVLQTALGLRALDWDVFVVTDACASRAEESEAGARARMGAAGILPVTTEMVLFEWLHRKENEAFKDIMTLIR